jgi:hypothetical protein
MVRSALTGSCNIVVNSLLSMNASQLLTNVYEIMYLYHQRVLKCDG